ncbi:hypothetical protein EO087_00030 [Dyella sp. M7H15-1]|uniref:hypothetical protein n=1 Tax=Dyella sp. M7H15-1 TaxID=2501295 RepID=UPI001004D923|nr:hypothetical protein [Dyella sp. M7H15-1]QAU22557.1 hypothetical protein EO087_00030 [Dyella sp. M7H15-1]
MSFPSVFQMAHSVAEREHANLVRTVIALKRVAHAAKPIASKREEAEFFHPHMTAAHVEMAGIFINVTDPLALAKALDGFRNLEGDL